MKNCGSIFVPSQTRSSTLLTTKKRRKLAIVAERRESWYRLSTFSYARSRTNGCGRSSQLILIFQATQKCFPFVSTHPEDSLLPNAFSKRDSSPGVGPLQHDCLLTRPAAGTLFGHDG